MPKTRTSKICVIGMAMAGVSLVQKVAFVPVPRAEQRLPVSASTVAGGAALLGAAPAAHADSIGKASEALSSASYPFISQIDWSQTPVISKWLTTNAATWNSQKVANALQKTLDMGLQMDPKLIKESVKAHDKAVLAAKSSPGLVTSQADHAAVTESIARLIASVPPAKTKAVFDAWADTGFIGKGSLNAAWYESLKNPADAVKTFAAFTKLQEQVLQTAGRKATVVGTYSPDFSDKLGAAAKDLADATYPLFQNIDWASTPVLAKWFAANAPSWDPKALADATDATLKLSLDLDPKLISSAVLAHDQAVGAAKYQANLVTSKAQNEAVFESIARMFAAAPSNEVKAVFDTAAKVGVKDLNGAWFSSLDQEQAQAAFAAFQTLAKEVAH